MNLFYAPGVTAGLYTLDDEESRHCKMVLRLSEGAVIHMTDGLGNLYESRIVDSNSKRITVEITGKQEAYGRMAGYLHIAVAPTKNIDRMEWFLEKSTEIGIDEITPLVCDHSERRQLRSERLEKVITAAMKQSYKAYRPKLNELTDFNKFIARDHPEGRFIAHLEGENPILLKRAYKKDSHSVILIGPEGDFSQQELKLASEHGFQCVSLGDCRLRTETAALVACHTIRLLNQE